MLYHLLYPLHEQYALFNVFRYITFRTAGAIVTAILLALVLGPRFIATLRRLSVGQNIREVGPQSHLVKAGTPTMGGLLILFTLVVPTRTSTSGSPSASPWDSARSASSTTSSRCGAGATSVSRRAPSSCFRSASRRSPVRCCG